jgi:hypothetical protein
MAGSAFETAKDFFQACESGKGWTVCKDFCVADAPWDCQGMWEAFPEFKEVKTIEDYTDWMKGLADTMGDKATFEISAAAFDEERSTALIFAVFGGFAHYVYSLKMVDGKVRVFPLLFFYWLLFSSYSPFAPSPLLFLFVFPFLHTDSCVSSSFLALPFPAAPTPPPTKKGGHHDQDLERLLHRQGHGWRELIERHPKSPFREGVPSCWCCSKVS